MFIIDHEQILQQVRQQSFDYFIKTSKEMLVFWYEDACKDTILPFPVVFISLTFNGFNYEDESLIFTSNAPELINVEGELNDNTYHLIQEKIKERLTTLSYVYCYQQDNDLYIHYEDLKGLIDFKLNFSLKEDHSVTFLKEHTDENPMRLKILDNFFKNEKPQ